MTPVNSPANLIFGQIATNGSACNQGASATASTLCFEVGGTPLGSVGVAVEMAGDLFIADSGNDRALEYTGPFGPRESNSTSAHLVFTGTAGLNDPSGIAVDGAGDLYVAWNIGNEILVYEEAVALQTTSSNWNIGPGEGNPSSSSLLHPGGLAIDVGGNLYAADIGNNRVLEFNEGSSFGTALANREVGQPDFAHGAINHVDGFGLEAPGGVAIGINGAQPAVYVADTKNNRVLRWSASSAPPAGAADIVIGRSISFVQSPTPGAPSGGVVRAAGRGDRLERQSVRRGFIQ